MSERVRRNIVISPPLLKRMEITAKITLERYYRKKYWIFWRVVWRYHHWKLKRLERSRAIIIKRLAPNFVFEFLPEDVVKASDKYWDDLLKKIRGK